MELAQITLPADPDKSHTLPHSPPASSPGSSPRTPSHSPHPRTEYAVSKNVNDVARKPTPELHATHSGSLRRSAFAPTTGIANIARYASEYSSDDALFNTWNALRRLHPHARKQQQRRNHPPPKTRLSSPASGSADRAALKPLRHPAHPTPPSSAERVTPRKDKARRTQDADLHQQDRHSRQRAHRPALAQRHPQRPADRRRIVDRHARMQL